MLFVGPSRMEQLRITRYHELRIIYRMTVCDYYLLMHSLREVWTGRAKTLGILLKRNTQRK